MVDLSYIQLHREENVYFTWDSYDDDDYLNMIAKEMISEYPGHAHTERLVRMHVLDHPRLVKLFKFAYEHASNNMKVMDEMR